MTKWKRVLVFSGSLLVLVIGAAVAWGAIWLLKFSMARDPESLRRNKLSAVDITMRQLATALEAYRVDHGAWPPLEPIPGNPPLLASPFAALCRPVRYARYEYPDLFADGRPMAIYTDEEGYIIVSPGPDGRFDITDPASIYMSGDEDATFRQLLSGGLTFDPTNGAESTGDIWRIREFQ